MVFDKYLQAPTRDDLTAHRLGVGAIGGGSHLGTMGLRVYVLTARLTYSSDLTDTNT